MTRHTTTRPTAATGRQDALFGDPAPTPTAPGGSARGSSTAVQDPELVADVVRTASTTGFLLIERTQRVVTIDPLKPGVVDSAARHAQDAVLQMLDSGLLRTGGTHHVHYRGWEGYARSVLVPKDTRDMVTRWSNLRPVHAPDTPAPPSARVRTGVRRPSLTQDPSGPILIEVTGPGHGQVSCAKFRGQIRHDGARYVIETDTGQSVGRASSYRNGAYLLARHLGYTPGPIEINHNDNGHRAAPTGSAPPRATTPAGRVTGHKPRRRP